MGDKWERSYKREFVPKNKEEEFPVPIPAEVYKNGEKVSDELDRFPHIKNGRIQFREEDLKKAFAESFSRIDELVDEQMSKAKQKGASLQVSQPTHFNLLQIGLSDLLFSGYHPRRWSWVKPVPSPASERKIFKTPTGRYQIHGNEAVSHHNRKGSCKGFHLTKETAEQQFVEGQSTKDLLKAKIWAQEMMTTTT